MPILQGEASAEAQWDLIVASRGSRWARAILLKNAGLEEPQDAALKEWRESVGERVSRALEDRHVRPTQEQINKNLVGIHTRHTRHVVKADSSRSIQLGTEFSN